MSESCPLRTNQRPRRRIGGWFASLSAVILSHHISPADCFGGLKQVKSSSMRTTRIGSSTSALQFRNTAEEHGTTTSSFPASFSTELFSTTVTQPTWLAIDRAHLLRDNLQRLTTFMRDSYFTEHEILQLSNAIDAASAGDDNIASGAAEFCLLLAETIDVGLYALTAGAIHYCACARNRQRGIESGATSGLFGMTSASEPALDLRNYGSHVLDIVADAGRLKQLEMVAASVMQEQGNRISRDRHDSENLRHLLLTETKDWRALAIRTAASLFRLRGILTAKQASLTKESVRAAREALYLYAPLASSLGMHRLKNELESAAFKILYRRQYEAVHSLHQRRGGASDNNIGESMQRVLEEVKTEMTEMLRADKDFNKDVEEFEVTARVKEPYSMWKKMLRHGYDHVLQVPDALALRIVLKAKKLTPDEPSDVTIARERALCYYAQKRCQERWQPVASNPRFKDYIARPKQNGYQSLHYTAQTCWQGESWTLEVQVRSAAMHQVAEFGLACHWDYKAATNRDTEKKQEFTVTISDEDKSSDSYLRNVQQYWMRHGGSAEVNMASVEPVVLSDMWESRERADRIRARTERLRPYLQALTTTQSDLARERVFVFMTAATEKAEGSKVLALPSGACVLDALREGERTMKVGPLSTAWVNGQESSITKQLHNGDILKFSLATPTVSA
jgi:ppGpp synthetase/RelA/SpoT-type nucleotidyltranferase